MRKRAAARQAENMPFRHSCLSHLGFARTRRAQRLPTPCPPEAARLRQGRRVPVRMLSDARRQKPTDRRPTDRPAVPQPAGTQTISRPHTHADQTDRHADRTHGTGADTERRKTDETRRVAGGRTEPSKTESRQKIGAKARKASKILKNITQHNSSYVA